MARLSDAWAVVAAALLATACHRRPAAPPATAALPIAAPAPAPTAPLPERRRTVARDEPSARPTAPRATQPADNDMPRPPPRAAPPPPEVPTWTSVAGDNTSSGRLPMWRQRAKNY